MDAADTRDVCQHILRRTRDQKEYEGHRLDALAVLQERKAIDLLLAEETIQQRGPESSCQGEYQSGSDEAPDETDQQTTESTVQRTGDDLHRPSGDKGDDYLQYLDTKQDKPSPKT